MAEKNKDISKSILLQLAKGDKLAFKSVFNSYNQKLYFFALGYLKSEKDAEEIVQETFLKIWERKEFINPELSFQAYLFKIAFNFIQKRLIKKMNDEELKHDLADELVHFDSQTSNMVNYHFLLQHINQLIDKLPPRQKEIVELRKLQGYSTKEIAEQLSLALKTVEAHLTAALKFLKEQLESEKFDDLLLFALTFRNKHN